MRFERREQQGETVGIMVLSHAIQDRREIVSGGQVRLRPTPSSTRCGDLGKYGHANSPNPAFAVHFVLATGLAAAPVTDCPRPPDDLVRQKLVATGCSTRVGGVGHDSADGKRVPR